MSGLILGKTDPFSPYRIPRSILRAWWCADDHGTALMTDDGGGLISSWKDRINALEVTAATTARPTWAATAFNGAYAGLTFDGVDDVMTMPTLDPLVPSGANPSTIVAVCDPGAFVSGVECAVSYGANGNATRRQMQRSNLGLLQANDQSAAFNVVGTTIWASPTIGLSQFEASLLSLYQDGTLLGTDDGTLNTTATLLRVGTNAATSAAAFFGGPIRHLLIFAGVLTPAQRQQVEGWCAWDSGLSGNLAASHPYKWVRP